MTSALTILGVDPAIRATGLALFCPGERVIRLRTAANDSALGVSRVPAIALEITSGWLTEALAGKRLSMVVIENVRMPGRNAGVQRDLAGAMLAWQTALTPFSDRIETPTPATWRSGLIQPQRDRKAWKRAAIQAAKGLAERHGRGEAPANDHEAEALCMAVWGAGVLRRKRIEDAKALAMSQRRRQAEIWEAT